MNLSISPELLLLIGMLLFLFVSGVLILLQALSMKETARIPEVNNRVFKLEGMLQNLMNNIQLNKMESDFNQILLDREKSASEGSPPHQRGSHNEYRTRDGRYSAGSMEELLAQMANDPNSDLNPQELEALKHLFEQISKDMDDDTDDDDSGDKK